MNAKALLSSFFKERLCEKAQWEIREVAEKMLDLVYPIAPTIFQNAGPSCWSEGKCYQGNKSCGNILKVREKYLDKKKFFVKE